MQDGKESNLEPKTCRLAILEGRMAEKKAKSRSKHFEGGGDMDSN